jgi:hypothetical protein
VKKNELKTILKPLIKECIKEVIFEDGTLSGIITEVAKGTIWNYHRSSKGSSRNFSTFYGAGVCSTKTNNPIITTKSSGY